MKTVKQIADQLGIEKQKVYRFIKKNHINEALQKNGVMYYDEAAETLIEQGFSENIVDNTASSEAHQNCFNEAVNEAVFLMLQKELEIKNRQIDELNARLAETTAALVAAQQTAQTAQALHAGTIQQQLTSGAADPTPDIEPEPRKGFFAKWFTNGRNEK